MPKLTERMIAAATVLPGRKDRLLFDTECAGLGLRITVAGGRGFLHQWRDAATGARRREPLGSWPALTLAHARDALRVRAGKLAQGIDPAAERAARKAEATRATAEAALTLDRLIDDWHVLHLSDRRPRYAAEAVRALRYGLAPLLARPAIRLDRADVLPLLDALAKDGKPAMAARTAAYGRACFQWAMKRGLLPRNPFALLPLRAVTPARDRVLADGELAAIWRAAEASTGRFGSLVRMLLLTGQRREEAAGMAWPEIADDMATWTIPGSRTKNAAPHTVPLAEPVRAILRATPRCGKLVFGGPDSKAFAGWSKAKTRLDARSGVTSWRLHDLRRTLATGMQRLGVRLEVVEAVLNHTSGTRAGIVGIYQRHDWAAEKRAALDAWARHVAAVTTGEAPGVNVVALRA